MKTKLFIIVLFFFPGSFLTSDMFAQMQGPIPEHPFINTVNYVLNRPDLKIDTIRHTYYYEQGRSVSPPIQTYKSFTRSEDKLTDTMFVKSGIGFLSYLPV